MLTRLSSLSLALVVGAIIFGATAAGILVGRALGENGRDCVAAALLLGSNR